MKTVKIIAVILLIIVLVPLASWVLWNFQSARPLNLLIVNKTVLGVDRNEHRALFWLLNHEKFVKDDLEPYDIHTDYYGFHPQKPIKLRKYDVMRIRQQDISQITDSFDIAYFVDTYGVFFNDWYNTDQDQGRGNLIEGGLNNNDYLLIKDMMELRKPVIAEYNFFAQPTDGLVRWKTEELMGISWSGWTGSYINQLNPRRNRDLPARIINMYRVNHKDDWSFEGPGILLVNEARKAVVVLEAGKHLNETIITQLVTTEFGKEHYDLPGSVHYPGWFDIINSQSHHVVSEFRLPVNSSGRELLDKYELPDHFPAITESAYEAPFYYFSGNFSNSKVNLYTSRLKGIMTFDRLLINNRINSMSRFYWTYYLPFVSGILSEHQEDLY